MQRAHLVPIPIGDLDWDEGLATYDATPFAAARAANGSVSGLVPAIAGAEAEAEARSERRLRPPEGAARILDQLAERQLNVTVALFCLDHASQVAPADPWSRAAFDSLRARIAELSQLLEALESLHEGLTDALLLAPGSPAPGADLLAAEGSLAAFVHGLYTWCEEIVLALTDLAIKMRRLEHDWDTLRARLEEASSWYFDGLTSEIRAEARSRRAPTALREQLEAVFFAACRLEDGLARRFG